MALGDVIARLSVSLSLNSSNFEKGTKRTQAQAETFGKKMGRVASAIGTAFVASIGVDTVRAWADATKGALEFAGSLGETAQQLGVTTTELQEFRFMATQTGIEQSQMDKALQKTTRTLGELATPTKAQTAAMKELGLSAKDLEGIGTAEFVALLADKFKGLTAAQQAALGAQLGLGKSFQTLIPLLNEGSKGIEAMTKAAHDMGIVISEEAIKNADKNADLISTYEQIATAQKNAALTLPENVRAYVAYEKAVTDLQLGFYKLVGGLSAWAAENKHWETDVVPAWRAFEAWAIRFQKTISDVVLYVPRAIGRMVTSISTWIVDKLGQVWDKAAAKVESMKAAFWGLFDDVIGHSSIPDLVNGIASWMGKLDDVMVKPVTAATSKAEQEFRDMAANLQPILDRLFPDMRRVLDFRADRATIEGSGLSGADKAAALGALSKEFGQVGPDFGSGGGSLTDGMKSASEALAELSEKAKIHTVKIADSFKDMADKTLGAISSLTSAIKGGGFLDILSAVIGLGMQLGSVGAFGKGLQTKLNAIPKNANGTNFHPGGLSIVGERGPELVSMPRGSRVTPNHALGGVTNNYFNGNLMTPEFWAMIRSGDMAAAQGGAALAGARNARSRKWSLAA